MRGCQLVIFMLAFFKSMKKIYLFLKSPDAFAVWKNSLLAVSGDGTLAAYDLYKQRLRIQSETMHSELLSLATTDRQLPIEFEYIYNSNFLILMGQNFSRFGKNWENFINFYLKIVIYKMLEIFIYFIDFMLKSLEFFI